MAAREAEVARPCPCVPRVLGEQRGDPVGTCRMRGEPWRPRVPRMSPQQRARAAVRMASCRALRMRSWP